MIATGEEINQSIACFLARASEKTSMGWQYYYRIAGCLVVVRCSWGGPCSGRATVAGVVVWRFCRDTEQREARLSPGREGLRRRVVLGWFELLATIGKRTSCL